MRKPVHPVAPPVALVLAFLPALLQAQAGKPDFDPGAKLALVQRALANMAEPAGFAFETSVKTESPLTRQRGESVPTRLQGTWSGERLHFRCGDDEGVMIGRRLLTRSEKGPWRRRSGKLADGSVLPHVLDPETFFAALSEAKLVVIAADVGTFVDRPVEIVTLHADDDVARELVWADVVPAGTDLTALLMARLGAMGRVPPPQTTHELDLALFIDPATRQVLQVKARCYSQPKGGGAAMGGVVVAGGRVVVRQEGGADDQRRDAASEPPPWKDGLPMRDRPVTENWTTTTYDIVFSEHGKAEAPDLDADARALLRLGTGR